MGTIHHHHGHPPSAGFDMAQISQIITNTVEQVLARKESNNSLPPPPRVGNHAEEFRVLQREIEMLQKSRHPPPPPPRVVPFSAEIIAA